MKMSKLSAAAVAVLCCSGLFLNSCVYDVPVYGGVSVNGGYGGVSVSAWTDASYDANGFPIYGYYYGRPVYGYSATGAAIFTFAALTAACFVPHWAPAPWYHGHWHYPHHIHRVSAPKHFPHDHCPARRPIGGLQAPIHKNPQSVLHNNHHVAPAPLHNNRAPQVNRLDFRDNGPAKHHQAPFSDVNRPGHKNNRANNLPVFNPQQHKDNHRDAGVNAPFMNNNAAPNRNLQKHHANLAPQINRPAAPSAPSMPQINRPAAPSAPSMPQMHRPAAPSAPSHVGHHFGGNNGGGHGKHHR